MGAGKWLLIIYILAMLISKGIIRMQVLQEIMAGMIRNL